MTTDHTVADHPYDQPRDSTPSAWEIQASRQHPKYHIRSGLSLVKGKPGYYHYDSLILTKRCQEWRFIPDHGGTSAAVSCNNYATLRSTTHQGYPLGGSQANGYQGNGAWLVCTWCVDEQRIDEITHGFPRETTYIRLDSGQAY